jgi:hypothetical protein
MGHEHPEEGDTLVLTDIVHDKCIVGLPLPSGYKLKNSDQTFDNYEITVENITTTHRNRQMLTVSKEDGTKVNVIYRGREPVSGIPGQPIRASNSQGAGQGWNWHKK